jgi:polygalacturonase
MLAAYGGKRTAFKKKAKSKRKKHTPSINAILQTQDMTKTRIMVVTFKNCDISTLWQALIVTPKYQTHFLQACSDLYKKNYKKMT